MNVLIILLSVMAAQFTNHRKILLFAPDADHPLLKAQNIALENDPDGLKERDLKIEVILYDEKNAQTFRKFKVSDKNFAFILIGKDGGEKLRSDEIVSLQKLYATIDPRPMRRSEMRSKNER